ncbi:M15 family metallopeptidase [Candidatus Stoquefichus sp. SB1]|jgi:D-alanyl-D-alanine carboxypeptidase|uniref:M15 family metallopeptidase n=1 Tax=Candidatus Stoquefichus sp. SB1 TaxID=1658109 RepID=UPI00067F3A3F|nr:M15 family metallopeptidase [Candidatus Stoquefichus sp. SB1]
MRFNKGRRYTYYSSYSSSRRKRIRWDRIAIIGVVVALIIGALVWFNLSRLKLLFKGYSFSQQNEILALDGKQIDEILSHDKMSHIEDWIATSQNVEYYDEYEKYFSIHKDLKVKVVVTTVDDIFNNYVPQLTGLGYTNDQIWQLLKTASASDLKYLLDKQYTYSQIQPYMQVKGYVLTDMEKYMQVYAEKKNYNYAVLITTYPFIISENKATQTYTIQNPDDILTLVKKGFQLADSYVPSDLVKPNIPVAPDCDNSMMRKEAAEALEEMYNEAKGLGYNLVINSAYRSYADQKKTYDDYFKRYDEVTAASLVALPGASEHQTGLSVDLTSTSVIQKKAKGDVAVFGDSEEGKWVEKNAYRFGFILRFPLAQSAITGIGNEPWHFRYVGKEAAQKIHDNHWLLEEYCLYEGVIPNIKENK